MLEVLAALRTAASSRPHEVAFDEPGRAITNAELAARVGGLAKRLRSAGHIIGIHGGDGIDWVVADLATAAAGRTAVPLPGFFSARQIGHIVADAGIDCVVTTEDDDAGRALLCGRTLGTDAAPAALDMPADVPSRIVYTSGTTGRPKGVQLGARQIDLTCAALQAASGARATDRHLSVLPLSTLLESICGLYLPIRVGARAMLRSVAILFGEPREAAVRLATAAARERPTTMVLTPQLLDGWMTAVGSGMARVPDGLRFVAVGGAPSGKPLLDRAWQAGIPAFEGYGLSECCSVVALNVPGASRAGTVGRALPHVSVTLDDGEIVVRSEAVMRGYVGGPDAGGVCRTGDIGTVDGSGYLTVVGRKDNLIVLPNGRKLSPEWVEAEIGADPRIALCVVFTDRRRRIVAAIAWSAVGRSWAGRFSRADIEEFVAERCRTLPAYARPDRVVFVDEADIRREDLFTESGKLRRTAIAGRLAVRASMEIEPAIEETYDVLRSTAR